jgi:hypothetical protein
LWFAPKILKILTDALKQVPKHRYLGSIFTEDVKNKEDTAQQIKDARVMFNNKKQLLCSNNLSLEVKKLIKSCIWNVALYGSETWTLEKNEEGVVNAFETWSCRRMLKIKWTDRTTTDQVFQRVKEERLLVLLKILKNRRHLWIGRIIRHNEFVANIIEGAISGK